jgi:hypothetical protein
MGRISRYLAILVLILGVIGVVVGSVFIAQAVEKDNWMREAMRVEQVTLGLSDEQIAEGQIIDSFEEAQIAGDTIREHRRNIAPTYEDLLGGGRYDPTNPEHLSYAQALNMENYLYLAVLGFGVTTVIIGTGAFMIIMGFALGATGIVLLRLTREIS